MKCLRFFILLLTGLTYFISPVLAQDYLTDDREPADEASEMALPFPVLEAPETKGKLGSFSDEPFLRDMEFTLQPRFYYRSVRNSQGAQDTFAGGGSLGFVTGWWRDTIQFGLTGYMTQPLVGAKGNNRSGLVQPDGDGFFTLGQAWMKLRAGPATATLYRQTLNMPFINADDSRMIPNTFEAYQIEAKLWDFLEIEAGYVAQMKQRSSPDFVPMSEVAGIPQVNRGTVFAGVFLESDKDTYLGMMSELTPDLFSTNYLQAGHTWEIFSDVQLRGDVQFADQRSVGAEYLGSFTTQLYGGRLATSYGGAVLSFAYTKTGKGSGLISPYGSDPGFNGLMIARFSRRDEQATGVHLSYNFSKIGLPGVTAFGGYVYGALPEDQWEQEVNITVDYRIRKGPLKNFWLRLRYAHNEPSSGVPIEDFRVILNYTLNF